MRWSKAGSHEVLSMLGLAMRIETTTNRSRASLASRLVTMHELHLLHLLRKRFSPCKLFKSRISLNTW